ncbi:MAG TPA: ABC transporter ATP-binding protein [bacterium]|nr:ABC transporter ATP-binding protein [bacterium]
MQAILEITGLQTEIPTRGRVVRPARGLDLVLPPRGSLGIAGESGCGKTMLLLAIMRLLPPGAKITAGSIMFEGQDLVKLPEARMRTIRGRRIAMVFQEPMTALNPVFTVGSQLIESIRINGRIGRKDARERAVQLLQDVRIPDPTRRLGQYPHELSGGMRQRVVLAIALAARPALVLADEPTSSLDVTIQARVITLLAELKNEFSLSLVFVSHDLALLSQLCDRIAVMYLGRVVEVGPTQEVVGAPLHPYTKALLDCIPPLPKGLPSRDAPAVFHEIPGELPDAAKTLAGCQFQPRCPQASPDCGLASPEMHAVRPMHSVACFKV